MFPINFNFPYRKKDGSIITMEKALDGAGADLDLIDLDDVAITTPVDYDGLVYDATAQKWKNVPIVTQAQNRVTGVHQFLYNRVTSAQVVGGLTITPNADGSFTVGAGTATSDDTIMVSGTGTSSWSQAEQKLPVGNYYTSCEGAVEGVYLRLLVEENNQQKTVRGTDVSITVSSAPSNTLAFIEVLSGTVIPVGGITIKPLIRLQSDTVKTIAPYTMTNAELTEKVAIKVGSINDSAFTGTGLSKRSASIVKTGNVVQFTFDIKKDSGSNPFSLVELIPVGFRPKTNTPVVCSDGSEFGISTFSITTGGWLNGIYISTTGYLIGSITYIVD